MTPLVLIVPGVLALLAGVVILRSFGPSYRVGRLLASTPVVPLAEALRLAEGPERYVAVRGRVDAEAPFEDEAHRPLVLHRRRLAIREGRTWRTIDEQRQAVPFEIREGLDGLAVDADDLDVGLVVMPRQSVGQAGHVPDQVPPGTPPERPVRLRMEYVSAVDHALVLGVPRRLAGGEVRMEAGLGRPLIVSTLEPDEAMRVLTDGGRQRTLTAALSLAAGLLLLTLGLAWVALGMVTATVLAASPEPSPATGGDPRSSGQGPGLVGDPVTAIVIVLAIALAAGLASYGYVRLTRPPANS